MLFTVPSVKQTLPLLCSSRSFFIFCYTFHSVFQHVDLHITRSLAAWSVSDWRCEATVHVPSQLLTLFFENFYAASIVPQIPRTEDLG